MSIKFLDTIYKSIDEADKLDGKHASDFATSGHTHSSLNTVGDKRTEATTPNSYSNKFIFQGLKTNSSFGSPSTDTYSYVLGLRGWSDSSGGNSWELAFNNSGIYSRNGASTSWGSWYRLLDSSNSSVSKSGQTLTVKINGTSQSLSNTTYSAGSGISFNGTTINHISSITAGTVGTSSATSGSTLAVPYITYNATGHITATGTHTHTITGFASSSHNHDSLYAAKSHTHDDRYYTESEIDAKYNRVKTVQPTGTTIGWYRVGTISSSNAGNSQNVIISLQRSYNSPENEHYIFAISVGYNGHISITQLSGYKGGQLIDKIRVVYNNSGNCYFDYYMKTSNYNNSYKVTILAGDFKTLQDIALVTDAGGTVFEFTTTNGCKSNYGFTGDLAGNASSATKLGTDAGSATNPIYFSGGKPAACTYSLNATVPSGAKFTDTTYSAGTGISLSGTTFSNSGVRSVATGDNNGTIKVNTNGTSANVAVKGLGSAAYLDTTGTFSAVTHSDYNNNQTQLVSRSFMSYWTGAYNSSGNSNLTYCKHGAFGTAATKAYTTSITSGSGSLITSGAVYTALSGKSDTGHTHSNYAASDHTHSSYAGKKNVAFTPAESALTTANVLTHTGGYSIAKGTWDYAGNGYVVAGDFGNIDLAGCSILTFGSSSAYTQLYITAPTQSGHSGKTNEIFFYNDHGSSYSPGWTRVLTNRNYGTYAAAKNHDHDSAYAAKSHTHDYAASSHTHDYAASSHNHSRIVTVGDQRSTSTTPNSYSNNIIFQGLKNKATINSPSSDTYSYLIGLRGWSDSSGGNSWEIAFNNSGINVRNGATTSWGSWSSVITSSNYSTWCAAKDHTHSYASSSHSHNFNQITDAPNVYLNAGTVTRRVLIQNTKNSQGYISRATIGLTNAANQFSPVFIGVGTNDGGTTFTDYYFAVGGSISDSKGNTYLSTANWSTYCAAKSHTHDYAASSHTHDYAASSHTHTTIVGNYTANGGQQNPNYFGKNRVGALMMNTSVNGNSHYKDWLFMDCYSGSDVGGGVAIGVNRQALGAYIMRSAAARTSWAESAELIGTHNYTTYCARASHTHNYAGSSSAGGAATSANKLNTDAGSATKPVYFSSGVPVQVTGCMVQYWAIYEVFFGSGGTTSQFLKKAGNHNFYSSVRTHEGVGNIIVNISYPTGFSEDTTFIFGNGDHRESNHTQPIYLTINKLHSYLRLTLADDASNNWGYAYLYFLCIG